MVRAEIVVLPCKIKVFRTDLSDGKSSEEVMKRLHFSVKAEVDKGCRKAAQKLSKSYPN
jgi:predicted lactoylglutathione lyase